ncbi:MAG TPA: helix-turn-helix transcriptional regulator [Xanthobacteraceae bacterium]|nr:helix-turn-helix transcriptional regulator [Xanthobacteraceae bacterium]
MNVRFQKTPQGEVAILPREEFEALVAKAAEADEDAGTARLVARAKRNVAKEDLIPMEVADRLAAGENPVRVFREWRRLTQQQLALESGLTQGYLSDIETGRRRGTALRLRGVSHALRVPLDLLIAS